MTARGGSKGLPGKNLRLLGGIPLVARAVQRSLQAAALVEDCEHEVVCSTDSPEIAAVARRWGARVPFLRPGDLSTDEAKSIDVALHACSWFASEHGHEPTALVLVQPTTPLARPADLAAALRLHLVHPDESSVTVAPAEHAVWSYRVENGCLVSLSKAAEADRRQEAPPVVGLNGAAYAASPEFLRKHRRFVVDGLTRPSLMDASLSIDVDTQDQLLACESALRAQPARPFSIGSRAIGSPHPCYVIAEAGVNHNGDVALAHRLVDAAADAGADAVKFQTFNPEMLVSIGAPKAEYQKRTTGATESQRAMLEALVLSRPAHHELAAHARARGLQFLSSPFDEESADFLMDLDVPAFKIPSGEVTNLPLLRHIARLGRPILMSTGMCEMVEVSEAMDAIRTAGNPPVALFHCVSNYPAEPRSANLRAMQSLAAAFGVPVGWSDHTMGIEIALAAAALDARLLEKHLTLSRGLPGPDHSASLEPSEFAALVRGVRAVESALGDGIKRPQDEEMGTRKVARKSLHWTRALPAGHRVDPTDLICLRPGDGLPPTRRDGFFGVSLLRDVEQGAMVTEADIDVSGPS